MDHFVLKFIIHVLEPAISTDFNYILCSATSNFHTQSFCFSGVCDNGFYVNNIQKPKQFFVFIILSATKRLGSLHLIKKKNPKQNRTENDSMRHTQ